MNTTRKQRERLGELVRKFFRDGSLSSEEELEMDSLQKEVARDLAGIPHTKEGQEFTGRMLADKAVSDLVELSKKNSSN